MQKRLTTIYVALGSNEGDSIHLINRALDAIEELPDVTDMEVSRFYRTTPVSPLPQNDYINAVCRFKTSYSAQQLLYSLQAIEKQLGKLPKPKEAPRPIDLDILFFGLEIHHTPELQIPHPRWHQRLFVLAPLGDLVKKLPVPLEREGVELVDISEMIWDFPNPNDEQVFELPERRTSCKKSL